MSNGLRAGLALTLLGVSLAVPAAGMAWVPVAIPPGTAIIALSPWPGSAALWSWQVPRDRPYLRALSRDLRQAAQFPVFPTSMVLFGPTASVAVGYPGGKVLMLSGGVIGQPVPPESFYLQGPRDRVIVSSP